MTRLFGVNNAKNAFGSVASWDFKGLILHVQSQSQFTINRIHTQIFPVNPLYRANYFELTRLYQVNVGHVSLTILLQQVLFKIKDVPIFVAGGIGTGQMCAHLFLMGAAGVQLGTAFAVSEECTAHPNFKKRFIRAKAREAISTPEFDSRLHVVAVRALRNQGYEDFNELQLKLMDELDRGTLSQTDVQMRVEEFWMGKLRSAVVDGDIEHGSLMAGQSVGLIHDIKPVNTILQDLLTDMEATFRQVAKTLKES